MLKRLVMLASGIIADLFTRPSLSPAQQPSLNAKPLRAKSTRTSKDVEPKLQAALLKPKRKASAAKTTTQVASRKPKQKAAQTTSGVRGRPRKTPAPQSPQHVKRQPKPKP